MSVENIFGTVFSLYLTLVAGFAAIAASTAIEEDDRENLPAHVERSIMRSNLFLSLPALIGVLAMLSSAAQGDGGSGIMSRDMGLCVLGFVALVGLFFAWLGSFLLGRLGAAVAKNLPALAAAAVVFTFTSGGAPLALLKALLQLGSARHP